jgi:hypothetical protein
MTVTWSGLDSATRYLGQLSYSDGTSTLGTTLVVIDTTNFCRRC